MGIVKALAHVHARVALATAALATTATPAYAHGVQGRADLPVPIAMFFWAAAIVLVVSFAALAALWSSPRLEEIRERSLAVPGLQIATWVVRIIVLTVTVVVTLAALIGERNATSNIAPITVWVAWWVGLVPLSILFGNVWAAVNPWTTIATIARIGSAPRRSLPARVGVWPAVVVFLAFTWLELAYPAAANPRLLGWLIVGYSIYMFAGMAVYGRDAWRDASEMASVYCGIMATLSPVRRNGSRTLSLRWPMIGASSFVPRAASVLFITSMIGTVSFDGLSRSGEWQARSQVATQRLVEVGFSAQTAREIVATIGFTIVVALAWALFEGASLFSARAGRLGAAWRGMRPGAAFVHSLIPIGVAYAVAHYFSYFVFQTQDLWRLLADPFGRGVTEYPGWISWALVGNESFSINYSVVSSNTIWLVQVGAIVIGHVVGLALAHDRALQMARDSSGARAVRSQLPMLVLMVIYTVAGLWFLSEGMSG